MDTCSHCREAPENCVCLDQPGEKVDGKSGMTGSAALPDGAVKAMCEDPFGPKVRPVAYVLHVPRLAETARQHGYALAVHGSLQRDLDLIACPWSEVATEPEVLIKALCNRIGGFMLPLESALEKPHGRKAWIIHLGAGLWIDLSIMPRITIHQKKCPNET